LSRLRVERQLFGITGKYGRNARRQAYRQDDEAVAQLDLVPMQALLKAKKKRSNDNGEQQKSD
jgi:hypothetical protein